MYNNNPFSRGSHNNGTMLYPWSGLGGSGVRHHFPLHSHAMGLGWSQLLVHCYSKVPRNEVLSHVDFELWPSHRASIPHCGHRDINHFIIFFSKSQNVWIKVGRALWFILEFTRRRKISTHISRKDHYQADLRGPAIWPLMAISSLVESPLIPSFKLLLFSNQPRDLLRKALIQIIQ